MATSSRQSALFGVNDWKRIYQSYRAADFNSYDYETLRKSFIDYLTTYYPETYNDYIESSEFVALLDVIAYMGQALAFRDDLNTRENFIDTAERRDSVIKLANLVSYTPKRNTAAQGVVKVTAVSTTENITDINGINLNNTTILWNDPANSNWQEQFNAVLNAALTNSQRIGRPGNSQTILGVKTDEYTLSIPTGQLPVIPYSTQVDGVTMPFELTNSTSLNKDYLYEPPPAPSGQFNILYRSDKLGYGSANTGFFFYFKQGTLQNYDFNFAERIENNFQAIDIEGINNTDTWLYQLTSQGVIQSLWTQVENLFVNYNSQGTSLAKNFTVLSRTNDQVTYVFGDGVFSEIPVGLYRAYVRSGNALTYSIDPSEMSGITASVNYVSRTGKTETLTFTFSLQQVCNTALQRETLTQIKERAPARYYTQNRMVNGEDYTNFPFTLYNSIVKSSAVNRSSIGVSRNQDLLDPTGKYSSTNVFADDGAFYNLVTSYKTTFSTLSINIATEFLSQTLPVLLGDIASIQYYQVYYPRYSGYYADSTSVDNKCYWHQSTVDGSQTTGYFYILDSSGNKVPVPVGSYSTYNMRYITKGAQIKFVAPTGYYFDKNNRLTTTTSVSNKSYIWVGVSDVIGDGYNFGSGNLTTGSGPITFNTFVPSGAIIDYNQTTPTGIISEFDNTLSATKIRECLDKIELNQDFALTFNNSLLVSQDRWSVVQPIPSDTSATAYFVKFEYNSIDQTYVVSIKNLKYFFGSVAEVRFIFDGTQAVYDPKTGTILADQITILKGNSNYNDTATLGRDYVLYVTGQQIQSDGYPDDYQVNVSSINPNTGFSYDPDVFYTLVGTGNTSYVFFKIIADINDLYRYQLLPEDTIVQSYSTHSQVLSIMYEYSPETVFFCRSGNSVSTTPKFYQTSIVPGTTPTILQLNDVTSEYTYTRGKSAYNFQYQHNTNNSTRIDPATTNIIDLYLVTQSYYSQYQNWINDSTGTVPIPAKPTINELQQAYGDLDSYKMISDSIVMNSVTFKPLFGNKAAQALQGKIKVIKNPASTASDSQIRSAVLTALNSYFTLDNWDFGDTFFFSELTAYLHVELASLISSVVLVPNNPNQTFGDLYEIRSAPNEIFVNGATINDVIIISSLSPAALQR